MSEETLQERPEIQQRLRQLFQKKILNCLGSIQTEFQDHSLSFITLTVRIDRIDPLACAEILRDVGNFQFYWEHPEHDFGLAGGGISKTLTASGERRYHLIQEQIQNVQNQSLEISDIEHSQAGLHFLGGFSFENFENESLWDGFNDATFTIPDWLIIKDGNLGLMTVTLPVDNNPTADLLEKQFETRLDQIKPLIDFQAENDGIVKKSEPCWREAEEGFQIDNEDEQTYNEWIKNVDKARNLINDGILDKIVLSRKIKVETNSDIQPTRAINRLRSLYTNCYCFLIEFPGSGSFIGCSPERLVQFNLRYILTDALAGSMSRGTSATQDMVMENRLLNSEKNLREHSYVVDSITSQLEEYTTKVQYPPDPVVKKLSNVQHLYTPIMAWLKEDTSQADILQQLHPTPAVGGYPTDTALSHIPDLELFSRGWYAGPVGWFNTNDGGEFTVAIRSGLIDGHEAHFFAGCGIVKDSDAESEWKETKLKLIPMLSSVQNG